MTRFTSIFKVLMPSWSSRSSRLYFLISFWATLYLRWQRSPFLTTERGCCAFYKSSLWRTSMLAAAPTRTAGYYKSARPVSNGIIAFPPWILKSVAPIRWSVPMAAWIRLTCGSLTSTLVRRTGSRWKASCLWCAASICAMWPGWRRLWCYISSNNLTFPLIIKFVKSFI